MIRRPLLAALLALCAGSLVPAIAAADLGTSTALLRGFICRRAREPAQREISVEAVMRPVRGTVKLELRFQLLRRSTATGPFKLVRGRNLGDWVTPSDPTLGQRPGDVWEVNHPVLDLEGPATYRFRVTFRWTGANGRVLDAVVELSPECFQPELRPDLLVQSIAVDAIAGNPKQDRYIAEIRNSGGSAAGPFDVVFEPGGSYPTQTVAVGGLAAHASLREPFVGPRCSAATDPTVAIVDPLVADDLNPANNRLVATCPGS